MVYRITAETGYLRADLTDCETGEQMRSFLDAVSRENTKHVRTRVLILVHSSKPIFQLMSHRLVECLEAISVTAAHQIAVVGDTKDLQMSHQYIELVARQRGVNVKSFGNETAALRWLREQRTFRERRVRRERRLSRNRRLHPVLSLQQERRLQQDRRADSERRQRRRREGAGLH